MELEGAIHPAGFITQGVPYHSRFHQQPVPGASEQSAWKLALERHGKQAPYKDPFPYL